VAANATVDTSAAIGFAGNWLLDPDNIDINSSGGCTTLGGSGCTDTTFSTTGDVVISPFAIQTALSSSNVTLQANLDITVNSAVSVATINALELYAGRSIILNAGVNIGNGSIALWAGNPNATGGTQSGAGISGSGALSAANIALALSAATGSIGSAVTPIAIDSSGIISLSVNSLGAGAYVSKSGGGAASAITISDLASQFSSGIPAQGVNLGTGNFTLTSDILVNQTWGITANNVAVSTTGSAADISLDDAGNQVSGMVSFGTTAGADVAFANSVSTQLGSSNVGGFLQVDAVSNGQNLELSGGAGAVVVGGELRLHADGNISQLIAIQSNGLTATSDFGEIDLSLGAGVNDTDGNHILGTVSTDGLDTVTGTVTLSGVGAVRFANRTDTVLGTVSVVGDNDYQASIDIEVHDPIGSPGPPHSNLYLTGNVTAQTFSDFPSVHFVTGDTLLHAAGNIVNLKGYSTITGDALGLQSEYGNIGGSEPRVADGAYFIATNSNSLSVSLAANDPAQYADIFNDGSLVIGNGIGAIDAGAGSVTAGVSGTGATLTQLPGNPDSGPDGTITAGIFTVSSQDGGFTLDNQSNAVGALKAHSTGPGVFVNGSAMALGQVDGSLFDDTVASGALSVELRSGDLSQTGDALNIGGAATFQVGFGDILLDGASNKIGGTLRLSNSVGNAQVISNGDMTLGAINLAGDFSLTVGSGGGITLADSGEKVQADNVSLTADGDILQDLDQPLQILTSGSLSATSNFGAVDLSYFDNIVGGTVALNAAGNASFVNSVDTTLINSVVGGSLSVSTNDDSQSSGGHSAINIGGTLTVAGDTSLHASGDITNFNSDDSLTTTGLSLLSDNGIIGSDGAIRLNGYQGGPVVIRDIETNGMDVSLYSTSAVSVAGLGEGNAVQLGGGIFSLTVLGDIAVDAPISSLGGLIHLDTTGNIAVNADITAEDSGSNSGAVWLTANDFNLNSVVGTTDNHGISNIGGTITASDVILDVGGSTNGLSGGIGSLQDQLHLNTFNSDSDNVSVSISTFGGDVFLNAVKGISFDLPFDQGAEQVALNLMPDTNQSPGALTGNLFVNAAGGIDQNYGIQVRDLTLNTTGGNGFITLNASSCGCGDPGNQIEGVVRIITEQTDVVLNNGRDLKLGASDIHGQAQFVASDPNSGTAHISVDDPNGGTLRVQGHLTLYADANVEGPGAIETGDGLDAQAFDGSVDLTNPANAVQGDISLTSSEFGSISFANSVNTNIVQLGGINSDSNPVPASSIEVTVADGRGLTHPSLTLGGTVAATGSINLVADGDITLASGATVTGDSGDIVLAAGGNFINQAGSQAIQFTGTGRWLIYSDNPADDTFGQLSSNNMAIFGTTYPDPVGATGNRYVFAQGAILTVTATDAAKIYGVDNSAALASGYIITTTALSVGDYSEAFLPGGSDASFSGVPLISSLGAGSGVNVGVYDIVASLGSLQLNGYHVVFQNAHLTVSPATLSYTANAVSRIYGGANPAFGGGVTGFVNGDTLASVTSGNLVFASAANAASGVGLYAINGSGLSAANYVFVQAAANNTALTITPATLVYLANAATRAAGDANPAFGGSVSGFVNGETLASATSGLLVFTTNAGLTSVPGSYAINGSGLSAANYVFVQAPGNATALTITTAAPITPPAPITPTVPPDTGPLAGDTKTALMGFIAGASKPPVLNVNQGAPNRPPPQPVPPPVPPPPPPPGGSPLAANNTTEDGTPAEAPNSSDQATSDMVASLEGRGSGSDGGGATVIIPGVLNGAPPPPPPPVDAAALPGFGNSSLWQ